MFKELHGLQCQCHYVYIGAAVTVRLLITGQCSVITVSEHECNYFSVNLQ